ncbi:ABC transporter ATP-binding protein [Roseibium aggregatum]|nr:ATP-binding cassette domain-containing protein [Roseibium aggregatum]
MASGRTAMGDKTVIALNLKGVGHAYLGRTVLDGIDLAIAEGEIVALVGPSGCGKSTLAHIAADLIEARAGRIDRGYRRHAMIFQEPSLLPWATAEGNVAFSLKLAGVPRRERAGRIVETAERVSLLPEDLKKFPVELSGGMKQRVAIARALAVRPDFVYFDEPFTALDVALRRRMQDLVKETCAGGQLSGLFITHDLQEAARLADRIAVLDSHGKGVLGVRIVPSARPGWDDTAVFDWVQSALKHDPLFRHIHDVDERQIA